MHMIRKNSPAEKIRTVLHSYDLEGTTASESEAQELSQALAIRAQQKKKKNEGGGESAP